MAALAKGLPVLFIPKQIRVATMRLDMIYNGCRNEPAFLFASDAPGMTFQEELPGFLPLSPVATQHCTLSFAMALPFMFVTIFSSVWHQLRTSRILARCLRSSWHTLLPSPTETCYTKIRRMVWLVSDRSTPTAIPAFFRQRMCCWRKSRGLLQKILAPRYHRNLYH